MTVKRHYDHGNSYKRKIELGLTYSFRTFVHCPHGKKYGNMQADIVQEKELGVLHLDLQAAEGDCVIYWT